MNLVKDIYNFYSILKLLSYKIDRFFEYLLGNVGIYYFLNLICEFKYWKRMRN